MARTYGSFSQITAPKVYKTALRLFAQYGYAAVSMRQIARDVGVQAGALYHYTPDKQTLLFTIMRDHMESLLCAWDACPKSDEPVVQLKEFIQFHLKFHLHKTDEVFVAYMELRNLTDENFSVIEELRRRYELALEQILVRGAKAGVFHITDARVATLALIGMLKEVGTWYRPDGRLSRSEITNIYQDMASHFLRVDTSLKP